MTLGKEVKLECHHSLCEKCYNRILDQPKTMGLLPACLECGMAIVVLEEKGDKTAAPSNDSLSKS